MSTTAGRRVASLREAMKYSQHDFAKLVGVSRSYLGDIEAGRSRPSSAFLAKVAKGVPTADTAWILTGRGAMQRSSVAADLALIGTVVQLVLEARRKGPELSPGTLADAIVSLYELARSSGSPTSRKAIQQLIARRWGDRAHRKP